jgi:hypothetical protein
MLPYWDALLCNKVQPAAAITEVLYFGYALQDGGTA